MKRKIKLALLIGFIVVISGLAIFLAGFGKIQAQTEKKPVSIIGYVDVMEVFESHPEKKAAEELLNQEVMELQARLEEEIKDMTQEERKATMEKYQDRLTQREQELIAHVIASIDEAIREVADEMGVKVVLDKKNVIYGGQDLTEQVKERILKKYSNQ
ncbi:hypothetical protein BBF96_11575 [Anoxybacter fermentans]|uniref:Molecular chaperone Skp n=1 Tax=Anoxybacter fermentans TaxID=1323375 RepID=A0A3Q9HTA7_9FIRM|nr:OmpH family outer membrane protein [Anoxybacter fermentans]AZR74913.1 hypothetical protein BBF96_11575 [Anoxybacter fermentans]